MSLPTPKEMSKFAKQFTKEQWDALCKNQQFLDIFTESLEASTILAAKILQKPS